MMEVFRAVGVAVALPVLLAYDLIKQSLVRIGHWHGVRYGESNAHVRFEVHAFLAMTLMATVACVVATQWVFERSGSPLFGLVAAAVGLVAIAKLPEHLGYFVTRIAEEGILQGIMEWRRGYFVQG